MTRIPILTIAAVLWLTLPARTPADPDGTSGRAVALEALAAKADLPAGPPVLPSLLTDPGADHLRTGGGGRGAPGREANREARSDAAKAHAAAAKAEAGRSAAGGRSDDAQEAAEKRNADKTRHRPKPPKPLPPHGGN